MPSEERFIHFNLEEIQQAISIGCVKEKREPLPTGQIIKIEIDEENPESQHNIYINIKVEDGSEQRFSYDRKFFALSLVFYCQGSGIPIPAKGQKVLNIKPTEIIVAITMKRDGE